MIEMSGSGRFSRIRQRLESYGVSCISGIAGSRSAAILESLGRRRRQILAVTSSHAKAKKLAEDLSLFVDQNVYVLPEEAESTWLLKRRAGYAHKWLIALSVWVSGEDCILVASAQSAVKLAQPFMENKSILTWVTLWTGSIKETHIHGLRAG